MLGSELDSLAQGLVLCYNSNDFTTSCWFSFCLEEEGSLIWQTVLLHQPLSISHGSSHIKRGRLWKWRFPRPHIDSLARL